MDTKKGAGVLKAYLTKVVENGDISSVDPGIAAFCASIDCVSNVAPQIAKSICKELVDQRTNLKLIASENYSSLAVQMAHGNLLIDKYSEGYPYHRFYAGCDNVDNIESEAVKLACELFGADHAYVQPHSGADANLVAFTAILSHKIQTPLVEKMGEKNLAKIPWDKWQEIRKAFMGQKLLALDYYSGGHLTHGYRHNFSGILFDAYSYSVNRETGLIDLDDLREKLHEIKPLILLAGYSAYPRKLNFAKMRELADEVGAVFMVDMSHFAGLVAGKVFQGDYDPVPHAHVVTSTTHKTLRGPRGGIVLCKKEFAEWMDKGCPLILGGPLPNVMAAKAVAFKEALKPEFREYANKIVENAAYLAQSLMNKGMKVLTGGTDNHLMLVDVSTLGLTGRQAETVLRECSITLNRNSLPFDPNGPWYTSGLRLGTPALTTLGMGKNEMEEVADIISLVLTNTTPQIIEDGEKKGQKSLAKYNIPDEIVSIAKGKVKDLLSRFPLYEGIDESLFSHIL